MRWGGRERRVRAVRVVGSALVLAALTVSTGCASTDDGVVPSTTVGASPASVSAPAAADGFSRRLAEVRAQELVLGDAFNRQFLMLQFLAIGLDQTQATCAADGIATQAGDDFATRPVGQVLSVSGVTPDVLLPCVPIERMQALARTGAADLGRVPPDVLRSTLVALAVAGYEAAGLTPEEADCVAAGVVGTFADEELLAIMTSLDLPADRAVDALGACVSPERADQLGA